ncbi:MAG: cyclase family protein [Cellulosilyticaceae bacterium]
MYYTDLTVQVGKTNKVYQWAQIQINKERIMGHVGTHVDLFDKKTLPIEYMQRRGIVFDVRDITGREITTDDIDVDYIKKGDFVIFYTGMSEKYPYGSGRYFKEGPTFSWELIKTLAEEQVSLVGIDASDLRPGEEHIEVDQYLEKNKIFVVENLTNLGSLQVDQILKILTMWHETPDATGLRLRVVATQP